MEHNFKVGDVVVCVSPQKSSAEPNKCTVPGETYRINAVNGSWVNVEGFEYEAGDPEMHWLAFVPADTANDKCSVLSDKACLPQGHLLAPASETAAERDHLLSVQKQLVEALEAFLEMYLRGANSGDWGNWNPEEEPEIIAVRAAIQAAKAKQA